ncbi:MAG: ATP binding [Phylliscum demangeonii]|nr:MAG: ATP binding [Phylliscum demangeonii]
MPFGSSREVGASRQPAMQSMASILRGRRHSKLAPGGFTSPTESEFSDGFDEDELVRLWDEKRVGEWLRSINCGQYEQLFRANNVNGDNLLECDQAVLKEMGIKKVGDRVRVFIGIRALRKKVHSLSQRKQWPRGADGVPNYYYDIEMLDNASYTPPSGSPRTLDPARDKTPSASTNAARPYSRAPASMTTSSNPPTAVPFGLGKTSSRPGSPHTYEPEGKTLAAARYGVSSPAEKARRDHGQGYFSGSNPSSAHTATGRQPATPAESPRPGRSTAHSRHHPSIDGSTTHKMDWLRVIHAGGAGGETRGVNVQNCKTSAEITRSVLKKFGLRADHAKNHCFYVLDGTEPDPARCRRISDAELVRICSDRSRVERHRLILRKIHAGEPGPDELQKAARIAAEESSNAKASAITKSMNRTQIKLEQLTGEPWKNIQYPISPASYASSHSRRSAERERSMALPLRDPAPADAGEEDDDDDEELDEERTRTAQSDRSVLHRFFGQRPPSELISSDLAAYFPAHPKEDIEKTVRLSMRRSARLSRATSRLSTASSLSMASSLKDAPPVPIIAESWLTAGQLPPKTPRPLSLARVGLPQSSYRDSIASSALEPLQEESSLEPNRKSYVSFESGSDSAAGTAGDGASHHSRLSTYLEETGGAPVGGTVTQSLQKALAEDGEEQDEELTRFIADDTWDNIKWMKGALIGQGSFGSVFLALHEFTGGLMAVKQVEMPSDSGTQMDSKKQSMVAALKHEIGLLRELQHENIVRYLGSSSDEEHLNIFLEYVPGGSVAAMLNMYGPLREKLVINFVRQILCGLAYLHDRDIIHRDIKGANVLVDTNGRIKISDFGISKRVEASSLLNSGARHNHRPSLQGSVFWMAPEVVKQTSYTRKADIWSLGCLVVEMFTGNHPYPDCSQLQAIFKIGGGKAIPTLPEHASDEAKAFLHQIFEIDHTKRPSANELLLSPFLEEEPT